MIYQYPFKSVDESKKLAVWNKGREIVQNGNRFDPAIWRQDICGNPMKYSEHGNITSKYGWEIDHIKPKALNGSDDIENLQPLHWENNRQKADQYPWRCGQSR
jgi:5-methylcytosine-specific restriction endonuclease McrA